MKHTATLRQRFDAKWMPEPNSGCWLWLGAALPKGYGMIGRGGRGTGYIYAHHVAFQISNGPIPTGQFVLHSCDNPYCVNPDHLFLGTQKTNMEDKVAKGRQRPGEQHPNARLTWAIVRRMRLERASTNKTLAEIGAPYGADFRHVHEIIQRKIWKE